MTTTTTYAVTGMTCEHCVRAVTSELGALPGVQAVQVELVPGGSSPADHSLPSRPSPNQPSPLDLSRYTGDAPGSKRTIGAGDRRRL